MKRRPQRSTLTDTLFPYATLRRAPQDVWNNGEPYEHFPFDTGRLRHVIELAADKAGWGKSLPPGEALGIAGHRSFVSYVAVVVHVKVSDDGDRKSTRLNSSH